MNDNDLIYLRERLEADYGAADAARALEGLELEHPVTLRANAIKATAGDVGRALDEAGIAYERVPWYEDAFVLTRNREQRVRELAAYERGEVYLQSLSSMLPPLALDPRAGESILDMAAAPGGKTTQMAALAGTALITACEKNAVRAERLRFNLERQGASRVTVMRTDARKLDDFFSFDKVLLDAPCSGSGTLTPRARAKAGFSEELVKRSAKTQAALLGKALAVLAPGGTMVYSTCSVLREENERVVERAVARAGGAVEVVPVEGAFAEHLPLLPTSLAGTLCVCPSRLFEGFFMAKLKKVR